MAELLITYTDRYYTCICSVTKTNPVVCPWYKNVIHSKDVLGPMFAAGKNHDSSIR